MIKTGFLPRPQTMIHPPVDHRDQQLTDNAMCLHRQEYPWVIARALRAAVERGRAVQVLGMGHVRAVAFRVLVADVQQWRSRGQMQFSSHGALLSPLSGLEPGQAPRAGAKIVPANPPTHPTPLVWT